MKKIYLFIFSLYCLAPALAQQPDKITLDKGCKLLDAVAVNNGLVLKTGQEYFYRSNRHWKLSFYNPDLTLKYSVPIPKSSLTRSCDIIASPSGNHIYHIEYSTTAFHHQNNKLDIIMVDSSGYNVNRILKDQFRFSDAEAIYSDDHYLYFMTRLKIKIKGERKKKSKLQLVKMDVKDFSVSRSMLELPDVDPDATDWDFFGNTQFVTYFVSRTRDDSRKATVRVAVVTPDGKLQDDFKMEIETKQGDLAPADNNTNAPGSRLLVNHNYDTKIYTSSYTSGGVTYTSTTIVYNTNSNSYMNVMLDPLTNGFYVYGITAQPEKAETGKRKASKYKTSKFADATGYFVFKFDQDGKQVWASESKLTGIDEPFKSKALFVARQTRLSTDFGSVRFQAYSGKSINTYELSPETGVQQTNYINKFEDFVGTRDLGVCHKANKSDFSKFLAKNDKGEYSLSGFKILDAHIVIKNYYDEGRLEMYRFDDQ